MRQELLELYFIVCFNKIEHFIRDSACNYVRNVAQWEHYTSTRALELICPAPHHQLTRASYGCNCNYQPCHLRSKHGNKFQITTGWQLLTLLIFVNVAVKMSFCSPKYHWPLPDITDFSCLGCWITTIWILQLQTISCLACLLWKWNLILVDKMITLFN